MDALKPVPGNCIYVVEPGPLVVLVAGIKNSANTVASSRILTVDAACPPSLDTKRPKALPGAPVPSALCVATPEAVVDLYLLDMCSLIFLLLNYVWAEAHTKLVIKTQLNYYFVRM